MKSLGILVTIAVIAQMCLAAPHEKPIKVNVDIANVLENHMESIADLLLESERTALKIYSSLPDTKEHQGVRLDLENLLKVLKEYKINMDNIPAEVMLSFGNLLEIIDAYEGKIAKKQTDTDPATEWELVPDVNINWNATLEKTNAVEVIAEEEITEDTNDEEETNEEAAIGESSDEEETNEETATGESSDEEETNDESTIDESSDEEEPTEELATGESSNEEETIDESTIDESSDEEETTEESATGESSDEEETNEEKATGESSDEAETDEVTETWDLSDEEETTEEPTSLESDDEEDTTVE